MKTCVTDASCMTAMGLTAPDEFDIVSENALGVERPMGLTATIRLPFDVKADRNIPLFQGPAPQLVQQLREHFCGDIDVVDEDDRLRRHLLIPAKWWKVRSKFHRSPVFSNDDMIVHAYNEKELKCEKRREDSG